MANNNTVRWIILSGIWAILSSGICLGQEFINTRNVSIQRGDTSVVASVMADEMMQRINPAIYYHWYAKGKIFSNQGGYAGNLLHGYYMEYGTSGALLLKGRYDRGKQTGTWKYWYRDGSLKESIQYDQGKLNGAQTQYSPEGKMRYQAKYQNSLLHGNMTTVIRDTVFQIKYKKGVEQKREVLHVFNEDK